MSRHAMPLRGFVRSAIWVGEMRVLFVRGEGGKWRGKEEVVGRRRMGRSFGAGRCILRPWEIWLVGLFDAGLGMG